MEAKTVSKQAKAQGMNKPETQCAHHWIIDPPDGPVSNGTCKKCGKTREFMNWGYNVEM